MKKLILILIILYFSLFTVNAQTVEKNNFKYHAFSGTVVLGLEAGATYGYTDYSSVRPNFFGRGYVDLYLPSRSSGVFGFRGFLSGGLIGGKGNSINTVDVFQTPIISVGLGGIYSFSIKESVFPYIFAGVSYTHFDPKDNNQKKLAGNVAGVYDLNEINYHADVGLRFLLSEEISMNINFGTQLSSQDYWDDIYKGDINDLFFNTMLGFSYSLFTKRDSDGDGVSDENDMCADTPQGIKVDLHSCPEDTDKDGVPDYLDKCLNTKENIEVDENGCALDSDKDGVADHKDLCPNTPSNLQVNKYGCPDTDNDGVADNVDNCPETPKEAPVDSYGCPLDSDNDGVPDYLDECKNTPAGEQVDEKGCATKPEVVTVVLSGDTNFEFNKAALLPNAYEVLAPILETMKNNPEARWRVDGHTDAIGSEIYNQQLSERRAQAVIDYFVQNGIERNRFELIGFGETKPVATNATQEGRAMNRRVEINLIDK